jgi:hypothetical protein
VDFRTWTESRFWTGTHSGASAPTCGPGLSGASAPGETGFVPDQTELRLQARWNHRGKVGDCRGPDWSDIVTSEQTPRGRDFGQASSGFCASRIHQQPVLPSGGHETSVSEYRGGSASLVRENQREPGSPRVIASLCRTGLAGSHSPLHRFALLSPLKGGPAVDESCAEPGSRAHTPPASLRSAVPLKGGPAVDESWTRKTPRKLDRSLALSGFAPK